MIFFLNKRHRHSPYASLLPPSSSPVLVVLLLLFFAWTKFYMQKKNKIATLNFKKNSFYVDKMSEERVYRFVLFSLHFHLRVSVVFDINNFTFRAAWTAFLAYQPLSFPLFFASKYILVFFFSSACTLCCFLVWQLA